ncbi:MAG TPA: hypothetical protein V6C86_12895 [Oculatellaceae cyanobacterium]
MIKTTLKAALLVTFLTSSTGLASFAHEGENDSKPTGGTHVGTVHGVIGDSMCKTDHKGMIKSGKYGKTDADCIARCLKDGMKLTLEDPKTKTSYTFVNSKEAKPFAGKKVAVTGHIDETNKVIHIHSIKADK